MKQNIDLLNHIHENSEMGRDGIEHLINLSSDANFSSVLEKQLKEYQDAFKVSDSMIKEQGEIPKKASPVAKTMSYVTSSMKSMVDNTPSHLAEILIQGSTMGITDLTKQINDYNGSDKKALNLAEKHLKTQQNNIEEMKKFL